MTPDPSGMAAVSLANPQSWNQYTYVQNNPVNATDPLGLFCGAENSFADCGGGAAFWGGGAFGDSVAKFNHDYGGLPPEIVGAMQNFDAWVSAVQANHGSDATVDGRTYHIGWSTVDGPYWTGPNGERFSNIAAAELGLAQFRTSVTSEGPDTFKPWDMRASVVSVLRGKNDCSAWFNQGRGSAADVMSHVPILFMAAAPGPIPGPDAQTASDPWWSPIYVSPNGRFYSDSLDMRPVGGVFQPGSHGARMIIFFHELAHKANLIPSDAFSTTQSDNNTDTVMTHCAKASR